MKKAIKVLFYTSAAVVGWQALRYFYGRLLASADLSVEQSSVRDRKAYRRATERWENEGGATLSGIQAAHRIRNKRRTQVLGLTVALIGQRGADEIMNQR